MSKVSWFVAAWLGLTVACSGSDGDGSGATDGQATGDGMDASGGGDAGTSDGTQSGDGAADADGADDGDGDDPDAGGDGADGGDDGAPVAEPGAPAVMRGGTYFGFNERFNRYYTDPTWTPSTVVYVSPTGGGDGSTRAAPTTPEDALAALSAGTEVVFLAGQYDDRCLEIDGDHDGTYEEPVVLYAERNQDGSRAVRMTCCGNDRQTCINLEGASHVAVDGFELVGGRYGFRSVGLGYDASDHTEGNAFLNSEATDQSADGVLTGASDWAVFEANFVVRSGADDGHGIYLSNGSDFNIVRFNDLADNDGATFQINADPNSCCADEGVAFDSPACDAIAGTGEGGRGVSDYMLIDSNYFHHGSAQGSNFTSVRYSVVRNNIFGFWDRHGVSFWSEPDYTTDEYNPNLGSHHNEVLHNLFVTTNGNQAVQFINHSGDNVFANNIVLATEDGVWMETDDTVASNEYTDNYYVAGSFDGRDAPAASEHVSDSFDPSWFEGFPSGLPSKASDLTPSATAPWLDLGPKLADAPRDMLGEERAEPADLGPLEH